MTDDTAPETSVPVDFDPVPPLADKLGLARGSIAAVIALLDEGNTVPFIARYRKERTGGLDEVQIRAIEEQRTYLVELETRRAAILASVGEQGKLTPELEAKLRSATGKSELEDLYAPYRPRRKTRASVAREKGLAPLAERIAAQAMDGDPAVEAVPFVNAEAGVATVEDALAGARDIVAEQMADTAEVRAWVRKEYAEYGELVSTVVPGKGDEPTKFEQYYSFGEAVKAIPSHRFLAIRRGEAEGVLRAQVIVDPNRVGHGIARLVGWNDQSPWGSQLHLAIADALKRLLSPSVENDVRAELKMRSDHAAVDIFAGNLRNLMLASPLGGAAVIGVDPGLRTGCKCAAIDATGKFLGTVTVFITQGDAQMAKAKEDFLAFVQKFTPRAIAVGNGTGGREAEAFVKKCLGDAGLREGPEAPFIVQVNEAGASVYSASDLAREEFPELDLTIRGAISIARRLQDPLAELVKIEPKSIGVGQYQHDVHQPLLAKKLGDVVEDCVNKVGVELNTASAMLLGYVAGIGKSLAKKIVLHRDANGAFSARGQLMDISGLGPKAFEQAAGFLRIPGATHPLDASSVHPERYPLVEKMAADIGVELPALIGNQELVDKIDLSKYVEGDVGLPTLQDIAGELAKPGRDPRAEFSPPAFRDDVTSMEDLKPGMVLEGVVTNVTAFGAFVDIGVHNDGLVHVSQLAEQFVKDPAEVVKVGQKLTVRVLEVDSTRKRIALSAKRGGQSNRQAARQGGEGQAHQQQEQGPGPGPGPSGNRRGGRGRGGGGRGPRTDQQQQHAQGGQPHAQGDQPMGDQPHAEHAPGEQHAQGEHAQGAQPQSDRPHGDQPQGGQSQGGDRRQWRERGPRNPQPGAEAAPPQQAGSEQGAPPQQGGQRNDRGPRGGGRGGRGPRQGGGNFQGNPNQGGNFQGGPNQGGNQGGGTWQGNPNQGGNFQGGPNQGGNQGGGTWQGNPNQGSGNGNQGGGTWQGNPNQGNRNWQGNRNQGGGNWNQGGGNQGGGNQGGGNQSGGNWQGNPNQGGGNQGGSNWNQGGGNQGGGNQGGGNQGGGNWNQGGGNQGGGNQGGGNWQGNPNQGGSNQGGGNWQGPSQAGPNQGGGPRGNYQGQGGGPRRDDRGGPRRDDRGGPPRRDDRGPRRDDEPRREGPPPENWGVGGFKNNPFAKLTDKDAKK